jgi:hypothetical protein
MARGNLLFTETVTCALAKRIEGLLVVVGKLIPPLREPSLREEVLRFSEIAGNIGGCPLRDTNHGLDFVIS